MREDIYQEIQKQKAMSREKEAVGKLAGRIMHDFNNVIGAIEGYAALISSETADPVVREDAEQIRAICAKASRLTKELRNIAAPWEPESESRSSETTAVLSDKKVSCKILLVEDEDSLRKASTRILSKVGYQVFEAENAEQAFEIFKKENPDILFTDIVMPGKSGTELARELKDSKPRLKVLFTSGYVNEKGKIEEINSNTGLFIHKPYDYEALMKMIGGLCAEAQA